MLNIKIYFLKNINHWQKTSSFHEFIIISHLKILISSNIFIMTTTFRHFQWHVPCSDDLLLWTFANRQTMWKYSKKKMFNVINLISCFSANKYMNVLNALMETITMIKNLTSYTLRIIRTFAKLIILVFPPQIIHFILPF